MPNCFQLSRKASPDFEPVSLNRIDEEMCAYFGVPVHKDYFFRDWYGTIGFALAMGRTFDEIIEKKLGDVEVAKWLNEHFTSDAFYQPK